MHVILGRPEVLERKYLGHDESVPTLELAGYGALRVEKALKLQEGRPIDALEATYLQAPDSEFQ